MADELIYSRGAIEPARLHAEAEDVWRDLVGSGEIRRMFADDGVLFDGDLEEFPYLVEEGDAGIVVSGTAIIVGVLSPVAKDVLLDVWRKLVLPDLRRRLGGDAVGRERPSSSHAPEDDSGR